MSLGLLQHQFQVSWLQNSKGMSFKSKAQARFMFANKPILAKEFAAKTPSIKELPVHHSGKGTRARLNTAAEKHIFNQRSSTN